MASIRKRVKKDGTASWAVLWRDADTGKQTSRTLTKESDAKTLKNFLDANGQSFTLAAQAAGKLRSKSITVDQVVNQHIESLTGIGSDTRQRYKNIHRNHIQPVLGSIPVDQLTRYDVTSWFNGIDRAAKTKKNIHALLSAALKDAIADGHISENPAIGIKASAELATREPTFLTQNQLKLIYETIDHRYRLFVEILADSGLRFSEASALRWCDITFENQNRATLHVTRSWKRDTENGGFKIGPPKTRKGRRNVTLPLGVSQKLLDLSYGKDPAELVFMRPGRTLPLSNNYFHEKIWVPLMKELAGELDGKRPRPHDLRHTHASILIAKGIPLPVIQARLGHESITTTVNTYGHLANDADALAAAALD